MKQRIAQLLWIPVVAETLAVTLTYVGVLAAFGYRIGMSAGFVN